MEIRTMRAEDRALAADWAAAEGWNPGHRDAVAFGATDPDGLLIGLLGGEPAATIGCVRYGDAYGFVGLYIVRPDLRGLGHGMEIWRAGHELLGARPSALEGVEAQVPNYERSGYVSDGWTVRHEGAARSGAADGDADVRPVAPADVGDLDRRGFGTAREAFVDAWLAQPDVRALGLWRDGTAPVGYGVVRPCRTGWRIGPLFAPDPAAAEVLLDALVDGLDGPHFLDVPAGNPAALALVRGRGMVPMFRTARMARGAVPTAERDLVYGVTTLELG